ncbi:MAG: response regulator transcription factor [Sphingopyxis sp.]|uniref:response regulator n=1 Tax=Sphingopyxis sp. TaxID=1908224 RepID=UPI003D80D3BC
MSSVKANAENIGGKDSAQITLGFSSIAGDLPAGEDGPALVGEADMIPTFATILIVDDHPIAHAGLKLLFSAHARYDVVGALRNGGDVASYLAENPVDIVILDLNLPDVRGVSVLAEIVGARDMTVVILTGENNIAEIDYALKLGARAVVSKSDPSSEILAACDAALAGEIYISPKIAEGLGSKTQSPVSLSSRQMAILHYLEQGHRNKEIGYRLSIAPPTVSFHIAELRKKLGVDNNLKIVDRAQELGLI